MKNEFLGNDVTSPITITIEEEERQAILLSLALLSIERPGWHHMLGNIAEKMEGRAMYEEFRNIHSLQS